MIKLFTDKEVTLNFALNVEGSSVLPEARMILTLDSGLNISLPAKIEENTAKITIPPLKKHLKNSEFSSVTAYLEVIAEGNYFVPWKDTCELKESIHININEDVEVSQKKEEININASVNSISEAEENKTYFKDSTANKTLYDKWNKYKKIKESKNLSINTVFAPGYFEGLDIVIKTLKPFMENLTMDLAHTKISSLLKSAVELKEKADNDDNNYNKEFYEGYYSAIVDTFISI